MQTPSPWLACAKPLVRRLGTLAFAWLALSLSFAKAQNIALPAAQPPVPIERFFQRPAVLDAKLSPSGGKVALTTSRGGTRVGLVVMDITAEGPNVQRAAHFDDVDVVNFHWVGDNYLVFSVVNLEAGSGDDQRFAPGLYSVKPDGTDLRMLVRRQGKSFVTDGDSRDRVLDWNHQLLNVPLPQAGVNPEEVVVGHLLIGGNEIKTVTPLWLNVRTGSTRSMELDAPKSTVGWMFDSQGRARLAISVAQGRITTHWRGTGDVTWRVLTDNDMLNPALKPLAVDDAGHLYVSHKDGPQGFWVLSRFDFAKGAPQAPPLVTAPGFDFDGELVLDRAGTAALGVRVDTDAEQTVWFDDTMKQLQAKIDTSLPGRVNRVNCRRCGAEDMVALVRSFADTDPGRLYVYQAATKRFIPISRVLDDINPQRMAKVDLHRIPARDGKDLPVWLTQPTGLLPGQRAPAVVLVHGGPWIRAGRWQWQALEQFLASRGYLVISPEFRGSTGYGDAHFRAGWKQWGQSMQDDVADALLWAQKQGLASAKACIAGASYGGYSALMGLVRHPALYQCAVAWVAVTDPSLFIKGAWWLSDDVSASARRFLLPELVGDVDKDAAMLHANSPVAQAKKIQAPLLLAFGERDERVPLLHGERLRAELTQAGRPPEWVTYPNEGHSWRQINTHIDFARRFEGFLARHLKEKAP